MVKTTVLITQENYDFLRKLSYDSGKSISEIIRGYIDQFQLVDTRPQVPPLTTGPINKGGATSVPSTGEFYRVGASVGIKVSENKKVFVDPETKEIAVGEVVLSNEFHPVPKGKK